MKGIPYLFVTTIKNSIRELFRNVGKLILVLLMAAMIVLVLVAGAMGEPALGEARDLSELSAMVLALYFAIFLMSSYSGLNSGATFFSMADVNLLFSAPIPQKKILLYGLLKQMGTSLMVGVFLLYQYAWLHQTYLLSVPGLLMIMLGYALTMFCAQMTAMAIYSLTSGNPRRQRAVKCVIVLLVVLTAAWVLLPALQGGELLPSVVAAANAPLMNYLPVAGWLRGLAMLPSGGSAMDAWIGLLLTAAYIGVFILMIMKARADFYEDVLKATEVSFSAITAKKEGRIGEAVPQNVKVGKTGLRKGQGAGVFFYKHLLEDRRSKLLFLDTMTLVMAAVSIFFAFFMKEIGLIGLFFFATYMQVFGSMMGRWARELLLPYVYLIPEPPFRKLLGICRENICKVLLDAVLVMLPIGLIVGAAPFEIAAAVAARFGFGILFMAGGILAERVLGGLSSKVLITMFYFLIMLMVAIPGVIIAVVLGILLPGIGLALGLLATAAWNLLASVLILFLCRDMLNYAEVNNR